MKARLAALAIVSSLVVMAGCTRNEDASKDVTRKQTTESTMSQPTDQQQPGTAASPAPTLPQDQPGAYDQPGSATDSGSMGSGSSDTGSTGSGAGTGTGSSGSSSY
jgi:hypothetical protein